jgi:hypothetical protein
MFKKELHSGIPNVTLWRVALKQGVQTIHRSTS